MTLDSPPSPRPQRVMVETPGRTAAIGEGLRDTFRLNDTLPGDMARLMERLRAVS